MPTNSSLIEPAVEKTPGRVERRKARTHAALLAAARSLFAAQGVEPTTIAEIAERADIAVGSFYNYFATKDELLTALLEASLGEQLAALKARQAHASDAAEKISIAHRHLVAIASSDPDMAWLLIRLEVPHRVTRTVLWSSASADLQDGIEAGLFEVADRELALVASGGALLAVIQSVLHGEAAADAGSAHAEGVLRSFGLEPGRAAEVARRPMPPAAESALDARAR